MPRLSLPSPVGRITLFEEGGAISALVWGGKSGGKPTQLLEDAKRQLAAYFAGRRKEFDLPLAPECSKARYCSKASSRTRSRSRHTK
jgi:methylated-DNA-[protein]-cysteine S-methyltransferase